jgi:hypothetical protein
MKIKIYNMRKNYRLLKKLHYEKKYNVTEDCNTYFFLSDKTSDGKLSNASVVVDRNVYVARDKDINRIPWEISK